MKHVTGIRLYSSLNVHLITDSLGLHTICILKRTSSKEELFAFWITIFFIYSGYGKYSDPLKFFTLCYIAAIC